MKKLLLLFVCCLTFIFTNAQFYTSFLPSPGFNDSLTRVVMDFKQDYKNLQGIELMPQPGMEVYQSKIGLPGALHCAIYRFHSQIDTSASWQAIMYDGDSYEAAFKMYKNTYRLVNKSRIKWFDRSIASFIGSLEKPLENTSFASSQLQLNVTDPRYKNFYAEIEISKGDNGWVVCLSLHNKKDDREE